MWRAARRFASQAARERIECDAVIIGAGPAGLSAAIKLKQLNPNYEVCVVEKASEVGAHIVSGNCFETKAMDELIPNWRELDTPIKTPITTDKFCVLTEKYSIDVPHAFVPKFLDNTGNYVISLSELVRWLGKYAEDLGVQIYPGFPANELLLSDNGHVEGIITRDFGIGKDGKPREDFQPGVEIKAKQSLFAEGCRGSLSEEIIKKFDLRNFNDGERQVMNQIYGIGIKEVWKIDPSKSKPGFVQHTIGWPTDSTTICGGFLYHQLQDIVHVGLVFGLDYKNPYISPFKELQRYKTHPDIRKHLEGGECLSYGARALNEGGYYSVPKLTFPGGMLLGCSAGFMNTAKIKGTHTAMKSGILAAETVHEALDHGDAEGKELFKYYHKYRKSWLWKELYDVRNVREGFSQNIWWGSVQAWLSNSVFGGNRIALTEKKNPENDSAATHFARDCKPIDYPKPDGKLTFDLLTQVSKTGTNHHEDQPCHLKIKPGMDGKPDLSLKYYAGIEQNFCPAGVYEYIDNKLHINSQNCIHCKTCDIKAVNNFIKWTVPEGNGGPFYTNM
mmetsp:Transcript_11255/g.11282  ORF Transcript_11255/g.11282 Transcript_11255/m.11282 type:complete len:560 (+) Transcript_11255:11-1690(+)